MNEKIDDGNILECRRFPIFKDDTVDSLLERTHAKLLDLFFDLTSGISANGEIYTQELLVKPKEERWSGVNRRMKELEQLSVVDINIAEAELKKVIRARYTKMFPPKAILHGYEFVLKARVKS